MTKTYTFSESQSIIFNDKKVVECTLCKGNGFITNYTYQTDTSGRKVKVETFEVCEDCGDTGVTISKMSLPMLISLLADRVLNTDIKTTDEEKIKLKIEAQEVFSKVAVNRKVWADNLSSFSGKFLSEAEKNCNEPVTFIASLGSTMKFENISYQLVKPYGTEKWFLTYGADVRGAVAQPQPPQQGGRGGWRRQLPTVTSSGSYVMVTGIIRGMGTVESGGKIYSAPMIEAADIVTLRK